MGQIYELTGEDIDDIIDDIVQHNEEIKAWYDEEERVRVALLSIFYDDSLKNEETVFLKEEHQYYGTGKRAGMYFRDMDIHICARDIVLEFIKIIFTSEVWRAIREAYCVMKGIEGNAFDVGAAVDLIVRLKRAISDNVIKLTEEKLCFYLQFITHFREHRAVGVEELLEWLPEAKKECCWCLAVLKCEFREDTQCMLKCRENCREIVQKKLRDMVDLKVLMENISQKGQYRINY